MMPKQKPQFKAISDPPLQKMLTKFNIVADDIDSDNQMSDEEMESASN